MARPKVNIDWDLVDKLLEADCEGTEIASNLGIVPDTLYKRCKEDNKIGFSEYLQQKKAKGNSLLKKKQFDIAIEGDKTMLVWLGKQRLNQKDKQEVDNKSTDGSMSPNTGLETATYEELYKLKYGKAPEKP